MKQPNAIYRSACRLLLFCSLSVLALSGCSIQRLMVNQAAQAIQTGVAAFENDDDLEMLEKAFPANIKICEALLANDPENYHMMVLLARLYASYTYAFVESKLEAYDLTPALTAEAQQARDQLRRQVNRYYLKSAHYARRALEGRFTKDCGNLDLDQDVAGCLQRLGKRDVPALFWYGFSLGTYVNRNRTDALAFAYSGRAVQVMKRVLELDRNYFHGGAHAFFLGYYASVPDSVGGNLKAAEQHYRDLKALKGDAYLLPDLYYARYYLVQTQNRDAFVALLRKIEADAKALDAYPLFNQMASVRAKIYLDAVERLFP
jgi:hypothetical protein